jgi:hypothetical protein
MTVNVQGSSISLPDNTPLYVTINVSSGVVYPTTSNVITLLSGAGSCSVSQYVSPGTTITSVLVTDASGTVIAAGN